MPEPIVVENPITIPVIIPETPATLPTEEIKFEDLAPNIQKFVDRERTKASTTARDKALRDALHNPDIQKAIKTELEAEATLTAEQKLERRSKELDLKSNKVDAREKLVAGGLVGEDLNEALEIVVSDDPVTTQARVDKFLNVIKKAVTSESERSKRESLRNTPKPNTGVTVTKEFKDMNFEERIKLRDIDPTKYKLEMDKLRTKI